MTPEWTSLNFTKNSLLNGQIELNSNLDSEFRPDQWWQQAGGPDGIHVGAELRFLCHPEQLTAERVQ